MLATALLAAQLACATAPAAPAAVSGSSRSVDLVAHLDFFLAEHPLGNDQLFRSDPFVQGEGSSVNVAQVRGKLRKHFHATHEETVHIVRGQGVMTIGDKRVEVRPGDVIHIPPRVHHAFESAGKETAVAVSFFAPAFDRDDRVFVNE